MLEHLPEEERHFYEFEENVIALGGTSQTIQHEIESRYAFLGGAEMEWHEYLDRPDIPPDM